MIRVAIYWVCKVTKMYELLFQSGMIGKFPLTVNGEMYMEVTDEQYQYLCSLRDKGYLTFRNKPLKEVNGKIVPA